MIATGGASAGAPASEVDSLIGMTILLGAWVMLFAALFFAYAVVRVQAAEWPPFGAPRLPRGLPALSTLVLVASELALRRGLARARRGDPSALLPHLATATVLGAAFLAAQAALWHLLIGRGLFPRSGVYGSVFFAFTGFHALHVLGGVIALAALAIMAARRRDVATVRAARLVALYWDFVGAIWILMYLTVVCL